MAYPPPPANLRVGNTTDTNNLTASLLGWDAAPTAVSYNVFLYHMKLNTSPILATAYVCPIVANSQGATYSVTSVNAAGHESFPSAQAIRVQSPTFSAAAPPKSPTQVRVAASWHNTHPRNYVRWDAGSTNAPGGIPVCYQVFRDGVALWTDSLGTPTGVWTLYYVDDSAQPGVTYTYSVQGIDWAVGPSGSRGTPRAGVPTSASPVTTRLAAPIFDASPLAITSVIANDDSCVVKFPLLPFPCDYRLYVQGTTNKYKYRGSDYDYGFGVKEDSHWTTPTFGLIEWNGISDPSSPPVLILEAVHVLGPTQHLDGDIPGMGMGMTLLTQQTRWQPVTDVTHTNGQGDPSNNPIVIARSAPIQALCTPHPLRNATFFDSFRDSPTPNMRVMVAQPSTDAPSGAFHNRLTHQYFKMRDGVKWVHEYEGLDNLQSKSMPAMSTHMMTTAFDGGTVFQASGPHNNNGSAVISPADAAGNFLTFDFSGGKVLHLFAEFNPRHSPRVWIDFQISDAADVKINPGKVDSGNANNDLSHPTTSGYEFRWTIDTGNRLRFMIPRPDDPTRFVKRLDMIDVNASHPIGANINSSPGNRINAFNFGEYKLEGYPSSHDLRHLFECFFSTTHVRIQETPPDGATQVIWDQDIPVEFQMPFTVARCSFVQQIYHTDIERQEQIYSQSHMGSIWTNHFFANERPFSRMVHWDNMGVDILNGFPSDTNVLQLTPSAIKPGQGNQTFTAVRPGATWLSVAPVFSIVTNGDQVLVSAVVVNNTTATLVINTGTVPGSVKVKTA